MQRSEKNLWPLVLLWLGTASSLLFAMADYGTTAGHAAEPPGTLLHSNSAWLDTKTPKPTLLLFAHPLCPCTRASLSELESVAHKLDGLFNPHILFFEPKDKSTMSDVWAASDLKAIAARIPGAQSHADVDGVLAAQFGSYTSGQVLLYDTDGELQFAGGITPSRGHTGSNPGRAKIISTILSDERVDPLLAGTSPVFGCSVLDQKTHDRKLPLATVIAELPVVDAAVAGGSKPLVEQGSSKRTDNTDGVRS
ncbi:MAG: hypothetical protein AB8B79_00500 [Granulosicoccus sp.]